jgi:peptidyl-prolyl cis-trans isomerase C
MISSTLVRRTPTSLFVAVLLTVVLVAGCGSDATSKDSDENGPYTIGEPIADSSIAAIVSSEYGADTLSTALFRATYERVVQQNPALRVDNQQQQRLRRDIVTDFVMRHLVMGEADRREIAADSAMVTQQLAQIQSRFPTESAFDSALAAQGFTVDSLRRTIGQQLKMQTLQQEIAEGASEPSAAAVDSFRQVQAQQVRAQHILFLTQNVDAQAEDSIRQVAEAVLDSAKSGTDFAALAQRHSEDGSAERGGDLGYFSRGQMVPPFEEAAFSLADSGAVYPELVETRFGYHIIRLTGKRTTDPMDSTRAAMMLAREGQQEALQQTLDSLRTLATVRVNPSIADVDLNEDPDVDPAGS